VPQNGTELSHNEAIYYTLFDLKMKNNGFLNQNASVMSSTEPGNYTGSYTRKYRVIVAIGLGDI